MPPRKTAAPPAAGPRGGAHGLYDDATLPPASGGGNTRLKAALAYSSRGWPVLPLHGIRDGRCTCGGGAGCKPGKHPLGALVPNGLRNASTNTATITTWWRRRSHANIGIATGGG